MADKATITAKTAPAPAPATTSAPAVGGTWVGEQYFGPEGFILALKVFQLKLQWLLLLQRLPLLLLLLRLAMTVAHLHLHRHRRQHTTRAPPNVLLSLACRGMVFLRE